MTEWEPATDAEVAMRNALRTDDQESYFRILAGVDLLLPVSADALAGLAPLGWGTWSTGGRTHVLAFTSPSALQACLADYTGSARRVAYTELAETWPNLEWWLAVNPGLPIEGYLPAWFVAQLSRGDLRLPTRGPGREGSAASNRIQDLHENAAMAANAAAQGYAAAASGGPISGAAMAHGPHSGNPEAGAGAGVPGAGSGMPSYGRPVPASASGAAASSAGQGASAYGDPGQSQGAPGRGAPGYDVSGYDVSGPVQGGPDQDVPAAASAGAPLGPGGLPLRTPGAVLPSGLPSRVPSTPPGGQPGGIPGGQFNGFGTRPGGVAGQPGDRGVQPGDRAPQPGDRGLQPGDRGLQSGDRGLQSGDRGLQPGDRASQPGDRAGQAGGLGVQPRGFAGAAGGSSIQSGRGAGARPASGVPSSSGSAADVPAAYRPPTLPPAEAAGAPGSSPSSPGGPGRFGPPSPSALDALAARSGSTSPGSAPGGASALGSRSGSPGVPAGGGTDAPPLPPLQRPDSPLPTRTPMAQTPPVPPHLTPPGGAVAPSADPLGKFAPSRAEPGQGATDQGERPPRPTAAQALAGTRGPAPTQPPIAKPSTVQPSTAQPPTVQRPITPPPAGSPPRPGLAPPVIPGAGGLSRSADALAALGARPTIQSSEQPPDPAMPRPEPAATDPTGPDPAATSPAATSPAVPAEAVSAAEVEPGEVVPDWPEADAAETDLGSDEDEFEPANDVERDLFHAVDDGSTDAFLSTLLLATVLVPVAHNSRPGSAPGESGFAFRTEEIDGDRFLVVFTSRDRLAEHFAEPTRTVTVRFVELIRNWPDPAWSFAVNPTSPVGAKYPGPQVIALASWATEAGLGGDPADTPAAIPISGASAALPQRPSEPSGHQTAMQKAIPAEQVDYYLERGYDRVAGFVHRASEVEHLRTPSDLFAALGLVYDGSPYPPDAKEAYVLRWPAYRPSLYRIPYGGQSEQALRAMDGWVIERPPFRGNGFAPGEGKDVIAEFKVDSVRLPHGTQLWRMDADGDERMIAVFDCDAPVWRRVGEPDA